MPKLHILLVPRARPDAAQRFTVGNVHEYWVTLYLIGEAKFEEVAAVHRAPHRSGGCTAFFEM